jgi:hypothetical protein
VTDLAPIDFTPYGLSGDWRSRRLSMVEGQRWDQPGWGVTLGHSNGSEQLVLTTTCLRGRFDAARHVTADGDPGHEVAEKVTVTQINLSLTQLTRAAIESAPGIRRKLARYAMRQACRYQMWHTAQWTVRQAGRPGDNATAAITSLAGWQSGFTHRPPGRYIIVHPFGFDTSHLELVPVSDTRSYGSTRQHPGSPATFLKAPPPGRPTSFIATICRYSAALTPAQPTVEETGSLPSQPA